MKVTIRQFEERDIENKIRWINDSRNHTYLHYDLPLTYEKTLEWFHRNRDNDKRYDAVIEYEGVPCGLVGLLSIDHKNRKAEFYISMDHTFKGRGIATAAGKLMLRYAFDELKLRRVYLVTERDNTIAQKLFTKIGFLREGFLKDDLCMNGRFIDRYAYGINHLTFERNEGRMFEPTLIQELSSENGNRIFMKREDLIPFSFGGNKARKAYYFFSEIDKEGNDCIVTYGSSSSNHCRVISNLAVGRGLPVYIISPAESSDATFNSAMMSLFGAEITVCPVSEVHETIERKIEQLRRDGRNPRFIGGGGHGTLGTHAYVDCFDEILAYESEHHIHFDSIFFASGTGTTQAGLVCGKLINKDDRQIVGISIARKKPYGRDIVLDSIHSYCEEKGLQFSEEAIEAATIFEDAFVNGGYGDSSTDVKKTIVDMLIRHGIPLDTTYTGKAYFGMLKYLEQHQITGQNVLFIHTGGTPLFFNNLKEGLNQ